MGKAMHVWGQKIQDISVPSSPIFCELKTPLKIVFQKIIPKKEFRTMGMEAIIVHN